MSNRKRFLLLGSIGVFLLAGLMLTSYTREPSTAFANGCNTVATGNWSNNCTVSQGNISNFVYAIQEDINGYITGTGLCGPTLTVDGNFGTKTESAVKCFQYQAVLKQDGIVGPQTWQDLQAYLWFLGSSAGWDNYTAYVGHGNKIDFRKWQSSGIWYVYVGHWCQINLSSPC